MPDPTPRPPPLLEMTVEGDFLHAPSRWTAFIRFWQALPRGAIPALLFVSITVLACAVILFGLVLLALPFVLAIAALAALSGLLGGRNRRHRNAARPVARR